MVSATVKWTSTGTVDEALIAAARGQDPAAFAALLERYRNMVFAYALARLGSRDEAEDVTQETFIRAFVAIDRLRCAASWEAWLMRILRNLCRDVERQRRARSTVSIDQFWPDGAWSVACEDVPEGHFGQLDAAVAALPEKYRVPLRMHYALGCTYREIATALGVPESTVVGRMAGGIQRLRKSLAAEER